MKSLPPRVRDEVERVVGEVSKVVAVGGGCVANACRVDAARGRFFLKYETDFRGEPSFVAEAAGLDALRHAAIDTGLGIPEVRLARDDDPRLLLLEWIVPGSSDRALSRRLGEGLAKLHMKIAPGGGAYGFERDVFIGGLLQSNGWMEDWPEFFRERRLLPRIEEIRELGRWRNSWDALAAKLLNRLDSLLPRRPHPALLHGDLWGGNQLAGAGGRPWLVDPAVYVGDREADLAMTELFGGFDPAFYEAYRSTFPLDPGYEERREIYNLYHLLNHLILFGSAYAPRVERTLASFGR